MRHAAHIRAGADSVTAGDLPHGAQIYPAYIDGRYANRDAIKRRFPHAIIPTITVSGRHKADIVDQENGDASPSGAAAAVKAGRVHTIYCSVSQLAENAAALHRLGIGPTVPIWTAHYTGHPHICTEKDCWGRYGWKLPFKPLIIGTQYDDKGPNGEHYDRSLFVDYWSGVDPKPKPAKPPKAHKSWWIRAWRRWVNRHHW